MVDCIGKGWFGLPEGNLGLNSRGAWFALALALGGPARAQGALEPRGWAVEKCRRYGLAWEHLRAGGLPAHVGPGFVAAQDGFIAGGCVSEMRICPESAGERTVADTLTLMAVAEGTTGCSCRSGAGER